MRDANVTDHHRTAKAGFSVTVWGSSSHYELVTSCQKKKNSWGSGKARAFCAAPDTSSHSLHLSWRARQQMVSCGKQKTAAPQNRVRPPYLGESQAEIGAIVHLGGVTGLRAGQARGEFSKQIFRRKLSPIDSISENAISTQIYYVQ